MILEPQAGPTEVIPSTGRDLSATAVLGLVLLVIDLEPRLVVSRPTVQQRPRRRAP